MLSVMLMHFHVSVKVTRLTEAHRTECAPVWLLSAMDSQVLG